MTGEQWRIWHSVSHRFPIRDKKDKHSALLLQEQKKPSAVSCEAVGCELPAGAEAVRGQTMPRVLQGSWVYKVRKPPGLRCVSWAS